MDPRLKENLTLLHLAGISTRMIGMISRRLLGVEVSTDTVSKSLIRIEQNALTWPTRPITKTYWALFVDGANFRIQRRGSTEKEPSLVVLGLDDDRHRTPHIQNNRTIDPAAVLPYYVREAEAVEKISGY